MSFLLRSALLAAGALLGTCLAAAVLLTRPWPALSPDADVFGFESLKATESRNASPPKPVHYRARDGEPLAYRHYPSLSKQTLVFVHGSSYHGASYHRLATSLSEAGAASVVLPNLRGHHLSGPRRGDIDYIGQLEDDLSDLIHHLRAEGHRNVVLGGHSSGGGLALRFAGGRHGQLVDNYLLVSPILPRAGTTRGRDAGGWASLHLGRVYLLAILNQLGVTWLNDLQVIRFNKPPRLRDGTETLAYSYRLNTSYPPGRDYHADLRALGPDSLLVVGEQDQANDADALARVLPASGSSARMLRIRGVDHLGVCSDPTALGPIVNWLARLEATAADGPDGAKRADARPRARP